MAVMVRVGFAGWMAVGLLLACDGEAHIRLFEPHAARPPSGMDASGPQPEAGLEPPPETEAGPSPRDAEPPPTMPDRPPPRRDGGRPPVTEPDSGTPVVPLADALLLHYDFSGEGDVVLDLVGEADALLKGGVLMSPGRGYVYLDGVDDYVDLPNGIVSGLRSATFVAWAQWEGGVCWQRIFDFGVSDAGEDRAGRVVTSLFMTPQACGVGTFTAMAELDRLQFPVSDDEAMPTGYAVQVVLVVDADRQTFTLYRDGQRVEEAASREFQLSDLVDTNNWLGRSQWAQDAFFKGSIGDFRVYTRVLSAAEIAGLFADGP